MRQGGFIMEVKSPELLPLFDELKQLTDPYVGRFSVRNVEAGRFELWTEANIAPAGKPKHEPFFVGLIIQKGYVGFYYMPIYVEPALRQQLGPDLVKTLRGKTCFHVKKLTPALRQQIVDALSLGATFYASKGWI
jgi:hypothetical protein